ncbi:MAG: hypothetical protein PWQ96_1158 [Clostridia bacterium]|jgi:hypothetical protein|nr:hypothetical protein [Clostridia bacterium]
MNLTFLKQQIIIYLMKLHNQNTMKGTILNSTRF